MGVGSACGADDVSVRGVVVLGVGMGVGSNNDNTDNTGDTGVKRIEVGGVGGIDVDSLVFVWVTFGLL